MQRGKCRKVISARRPSLSPGAYQALRPGSVLPCLCPGPHSAIPTVLPCPLAHAVLVTVQPVTSCSPPRGSHWSGRL